MNNPPYIVTDEFTAMIQALSTALNVPTSLNKPVYSYFGYIKELNETLVQKDGSSLQYNQKFPLVWLVTPFTVGPLEKGKLGLYGIIPELRMFIMTDSRKEYKAKDRVENVYKPVLNKIQYELFRQMELSKAFAGYKAQQNASVTDHYYWGEAQQSVLNDVVDTTEVRFRNVPLHNNNNC